MSLSPGAHLGPYEILALIGAGGMGEVYRARDTRLDRQVAIKILPRQVAADPERSARFEREARLLAALNHPHIVTIHSVERIDDVPFLTMELVEGRPLSALIPAGGFPIPALLRIVIPITDALAAAHQRGVTHRDLKPANVMVTPEGWVKVLDFGLAKLCRDAAAEATTTQLAGGRSPIGSLFAGRDAVRTGHRAPAVPGGEPHLGAVGDSQGHAEAGDGA